MEISLHAGRTFIERKATVNETKIHTTLATLEQFGVEAEAPQICQEASQEEDKMEYKTFQAEILIHIQWL